MINFFVGLWNSGIANKLMLCFGAFVLLGAAAGVAYGVATNGGRGRK